MKLCSKCGVNQAPVRYDLCRPCRLGRLPVRGDSERLALDFLAAAEKVVIRKKRIMVKPRMKKRRLWRRLNYRRVGVKDVMKSVLNSKGRLIPGSVWRKVRSRKVCDFCGKPFKNFKEKAVHHKKPLCCGGDNDEGNLLCVHKGFCHTEADKESFRLYGKRGESFLSEFFF